MDLGLNGKIAIVTGGSKGIGRATALALAQEGANVSICARGVEDLEDVATEIRSKTGRTVLPVQADMSNLTDIQNMVATTVAELGGVDILRSDSVGKDPTPKSEKSAETKGTVAPDLEVLIRQLEELLAQFQGLQEQR
mgnify:CR=1 FL=1